VGGHESTFRAHRRRQYLRWTSGRTHAHWCCKRQSGRRRVVRPGVCASALGGSRRIRRALSIATDVVGATLGSTGLVRDPALLGAFLVGPCPRGPRVVVRHPGSLLVSHEA
jgi:hypothetical protein